MTLELDKRLSFIESKTAKLESLIEKQQQNLSILTSKVSNGLSDASKNHTVEIERLKEEHRHLSNQIVAHSKASECSHITLNAKVDILEQTITKDVSGLKHSILNDIRNETLKFIERLRDHEKQDKKELDDVLLEIRNSQAKMAIERRFMLAIGSIIFTVIAPLMVHVVDFVLKKL